jgi:ABC-type transport system substrate-binding protein
VPGPTGKFVIGDGRVIPIVFVHAKSAIGQEWRLEGWGIVESLLRINDDTGRVDPNISIAEAWDVASDLSKITFKIRKGVPFHCCNYGNWGEVTAQDVAWSFNNAMREGSVYVRVQSLQPYMEPWQVVDERTVVLPWKKGQFLPWWDQNFSNQFLADPWITSKKIVDQLGEDKASETPVATGPYRVKSWSPGEKMELEAVVPHWRRTAKTLALDVVEIREPLAMAAALEAGEIHVAQMSNNLIVSTKERVKGSKEVPVGYPQAHCVNFTGNYWAMTDKTGKTIFPRPAFDTTLPWIGDPRDAAHMERARKVRLAMALAIDRQTILNTIFAGLGFTQAVEAGLGFTPTDPWWKKTWEFQYDPARAKQLLTEANYPNGFTVPFYVAADFPARINPEAGQAVAQYWREIGLNVQIDNSAYATRRPKRFDGVDNVPWYHCGQTGVGVDRPFDGGMGPDSTFRGMELPNELWPLYFTNFTEPDRAKRIENNIKIADYVTQWVLQTVFSVVNQHYMIRPEIKEWRPHPIDAGVFTNAETVVFQK